MRNNFLITQLTGMLLIGCLVLTFSNHVDLGFAQTEEGTAIVAVSSAEEKLVSVYKAVLDAEKIGADVSPLLERLDLAGNLLAKANMSFRLGDFEDAVSLADSVVSGLEGFESEAANLAGSYQGDWNRRFMLSLVVSAIGILLVIMLGFFGWSRVKKRFVDKVLGMKPEVVEGNEH